MSEQQEETTKSVPRFSEGIARIAGYGEDAPVFFDENEKPPPPPVVAEPQPLPPPPPPQSIDRGLRIALIGAITIFAAYFLVKHPPK